MDPAERAEGKDWPTEAETMVGRARLDNLQECVTAVIQDNVPGDLVETGVWRGGASILMRAVLKAYDDRMRSVWLADSFEGLPGPERDRRSCMLYSRPVTTIQMRKRSARKRACSASGSERLWLPRH
jgi:hypothetical protein